MTYNITDNIISEREMEMFGIDPNVLGVCKNITRLTDEYGQVNDISNNYIISQYGIIFNKITTCISSVVNGRNGDMYVHLICTDGINRRFKLIEAIACSFIDNSEYYLERGYSAYIINKCPDDSCVYSYTNIGYKI